MASGTDHNHNDGHSHGKGASRALIAALGLIPLLLASGAGAAVLICVMV